MSRVPDEKPALRNNGVIDFQDSALAMLPGDPYADPYLHARGLASDPYLHARGLPSDPYLHARSLPSDPYLHAHSLPGDPYLHARGISPYLHAHSLPSDPFLHTRSLASEPFLRAHAPDYLRESTPRDPYLRAPLCDDMEVQQGPPSFLKVDGQMYRPTTKLGQSYCEPSKRGYGDEYGDDDDDDERSSPEKLSAKVDEYLSHRRTLTAGASSSGARQTVADVNKRLAALSEPRKNSPGIASRGLRPVRMFD